MLGSRPLLRSLLGLTALAAGLPVAPAAAAPRAVVAVTDARAANPPPATSPASTLGVMGRRLRLDANCYDAVTEAGQPTPVTVSGAGFPAGRQIQLRAGTPLSLGFPVPDATGSFTYATAAPPITAVSPPPPLVGAFELSAVDTGSGATLAIAPRPLRVATLALAISPLRAAPGQLVNFHATGVLRGGRPGRVLWAHYVFAGRLRRTVALGRLTGPCGTLLVRRRLLPTSSRRGRWTVQFDLSRGYAATAVPRILDTLRIS